jgi:hypothetical protein
MDAKEREFQGSAGPLNHKFSITIFQDHSLISVADFHSRFFASIRVS